MSEISEEELKRLLKELDGLDAMPEDVAARMDATIEKLATAEKQAKSSRFTTASWALAAGFTLVFGLGIVLNLDSSPINRVPSANTSETPSENGDDVLTSTENLPRVTSEPALQYSSSIDYSKAIKVSDLPFKPSTNYGSLAKLSIELQSCLTALGLNESVSFVDEAKYDNQKVTAIWSAISGTSWQVNIIDAKCEGVAEVLVND